MVRYMTVFCKFNDLEGELNKWVGLGWVPKKIMKTAHLRNSDCIIVFEKKIDLSEKEHTMPLTNETYLGDGAYAGVDEYGCVFLYTSDGITKTNIIYLDAHVLAAFDAFRETLDR